MKQCLIWAAIAVLGLVGMLMVASGRGFPPGSEDDVDLVKSDGPFVAPVRGPAGRQLRAVNASLQDIVELEASMGCLSCCGLGEEKDCSRGFRNSDQGMCCNEGSATKDTAMCCPVYATCNMQAGGCMKQSPTQTTHTHTVMHRGYFGYHRRRYATNPVLSSIIAISCIFCCLLFFCSAACRSGGPPGAHPVATTGGPVVAGSPVYHGTDPALAGGGGFLGGLALGSLLSGPSYYDYGPGYGGWGPGWGGGWGGGGWGGDTYVVDSVTTTGGGTEMFAADGGGGFGGGDFGGGGGDFMAGDQ